MLPQIERSSNGCDSVSAFCALIGLSKAEQGDAKNNRGKCDGFAFDVALAEDCSADKKGNDDTGAADEA